ncbi:MAG: hypothetical protein IPK17_05365 [Chloroflexi bacterium]|uniref:hypothetical protein n=1 Tax=Candidatus Flexifilum breve TaxID=3140694 RepID=UPI0031367791|nr:hypothetical protein [Chloroflexota bacterium]
MTFGKLDRQDTDNWIDLDSTYGIELATRHLIEARPPPHRLSPHPPSSFLARQRWQGFVNAI